LLARPVRRLRWLAFPLLTYIKAYAPVLKVSVASIFW
jgi:hypothetical protein